MNYAPRKLFPKWSWFQFLDRGTPAPHVLPYCYFHRLKGGVPYRLEGETESVVRDYDTEAEALADLEQAIAELEKETEGLGTPISQHTERCLAESKPTDDPQAAGMQPLTGGASIISVPTPTVKECAEATLKAAGIIPPKAPDLVCYQCYSPTCPRARDHRKPCVKARNDNP